MVLFFYLKIFTAQPIIISIISVWRGNVQLVPSLKWQYFISVDGVHSEYPGNAFQWFDNCHDANNIRHRLVCITNLFYNEFKVKLNYFYFCLPLGSYCIVMKAVSKLLEINRDVC